MTLLRQCFLRAVLACCAWIAIASPQSAHAVIGTLDNVPAATVLYPYFEVDLNNATGLDTVLSLQNASATAILGHVVIWSDQGVPAANFNIYLTGFDVSTFSMRDVLNGTLPRTGSAGQDPTDTISPKGIHSQDINFASCTGQIPYPVGTIPAPSGMTPADLRLALTGKPTTSASPGMCWGRDLGDNHARGYVTIDTVNSCTQRTPANVGYIGAGGGGDMTNQNVMVGTYFLLDGANNFSMSDTAVSIESGAAFIPNDLRVTTPGRYTFYGRYDGWNAADAREPLATSWVVQGETTTSSLLVWRDSKTSQTEHACATNPAYYPLGQEGFSMFRTDSNVGTLAATLPFPTATQFVSYNAANFGAPAVKLGLLYLDLNTTVAPAGSNPPVDPAAAQSYVVVNRKLIGEVPTASGHAAVQMDSAVQASHYVP